MVKDYTTQEAAEILGVQPRTITRNIERGNLKAIKRGRDYSITQAALDTFKSNRKGPGRPKKESTS
jgi:excisionase family DNA binding protein